MPVSLCQFVLNLIVISDVNTNEEIDVKPTNSLVILASCIKGIG